MKNELIAQYENVYAGRIKDTRKDSILTATGKVVQKTTFNRGAKRTILRKK